MKIKLLLLALLTWCSVHSQIPNTFKLKEYVVSVGTDFKAVGFNGYVDQEIIALTSNFKLKVNGKLYARSKQHFISIGSKIDIFNAKGVKIGMVEEQIFSSWGIYSKYIIYDAKGRKVAISKKHQLLTTEFFIYDMKNKPICKITRPLINPLSDIWTITFINKTFDKRLLIFIPCYKTHRDNQED